MNGKILFIDDKEDILNSLKIAFSRSEKYEVLTAKGGNEGIKTIMEERPDVIVTDLKMPDKDGIEILNFTRELTPKPAVIIVTAFGTIESAVEALKNGAFFYVTKPINIKELNAQIDKALEHQNLIKENIYLHTQIDKKYGFIGMLGSTKEMQEIFDKVRQIAKTKATILITGESGTGKELLAKAIHYNSTRGHKPFIPVHCAALPETLLESELFGHEKGAFTSALSKREGRFELADGGTLFLDEVGEIPLSMQVKLLRVLETHEFMRVGGVANLKVDIRVITATNKNLEEEVEEGRFREDLYYRLKVVTFELPPLRRRKADIVLLVKNFIEEFSKEHEKKTPSITKEAMDKLMEYNYPGNVRELRNIIENVIVFLQKDVIDVQDLPPQFHQEKRSKNFFEVGQTLDTIENEYIRMTLEHADGNRTKAADILGISRRTLQRKLKELGIESG